MTPPDGPPDTSPGRGSRLRRIAIDLTPLKVSRDYRLLWSGGFISELGYQFARVAIYIQVTELTGSAAAVGLVGLSGLVGVFVWTLIGGAFIDAHDRRRTLMWTQVAHTVSSAMLLGGALYGHPPVWIIYLASALHALVSSIDAPTRSAMTPRLVGKDLPRPPSPQPVLWQTVGSRRSGRRRRPDRPRGLRRGVRGRPRHVRGALLRGPHDASDAAAG